MYIKNNKINLSNKRHEFEAQDPLKLSSFVNCNAFSFMKKSFFFFCEDILTYFGYEY